MVPSSRDRLVEAIADAARSEPAQFWAGRAQSILTSETPTEVTVGEVLGNPFRREAIAPDQSHGDAGMALFLEAATRDLRDSRQETRQRVNRLFYCMMLLSVLAVGTVLAGAGLALSDATTIGTLTGAAGVLSGITGVYFGVMYRTEMADLRQLVHDLRSFEQARLGVWIADQLESTKDRDLILKELVQLINDDGKGRKTRNVR